MTLLACQGSHFRLIVLQLPDPPIAWFTSIKLSPVRPSTVQSLEIMFSTILKNFHKQMLYTLMKYFFRKKKLKTKPWSFWGQIAFYWFFLYLFRFLNTWRQPQYCVVHNVKAKRQMTWALKKKIFPLTCTIVLAQGRGWGAMQSAATPPAQ